MKIGKRDILPFNIYIERNAHWFAKIDWLLFKWFGKKRTKPCGQKVEHIYCAQPCKPEYVILSEDKCTVTCKCCGSVRISSSEELNPENPWSCEF